MVISKGLGILTLVAGAVGLVVGIVISMVADAGLGLGLGLGFILAAGANWLVSQLLAPKPRVVIDPATGRPLEQPVKAHTLYFIPVKAYTIIYAVLAIPGAFLGHMGDTSRAEEHATPGHEAFERANDMFSSGKKVRVNGNTEAAKQAAGLFCDAMEGTNKEALGGNSRQSQLIAGKFIAYCQDSKDTVVLLCEVPDLRDYKSQTEKEALTETAWLAAKFAAKSLDPTGRKQVVVGLRGLVQYGHILTGSASDASPRRAPGTDRSIYLYPAFAEPAVSESGRTPSDSPAPADPAPATNP